MTAQDINTPKKPVKPVTITMGGNIPIGREQEPEKKNCGCGGKGCAPKESGNAQTPQQ